MADFAVEDYATVRQEAEALAVAHWRETEAAMYGEQAGVPITDEAFSGMESAGVLHVVTAREGGELAGYAVFVLAPNINMPGKVQASNLALYLFFARLPRLWLPEGCNTFMAFLPYLMQGEEQLRGRIPHYTGTKPWVDTRFPSSRVFARCHAEALARMGE